jgi:hypothetical protein
MAYLGIDCFKCGKRIGGIVRTSSGAQDHDVFHPCKDEFVFACEECVYRYGYDVYSIEVAEARHLAFEQLLKDDERVAQERAQAMRDELEATLVMRFYRWIMRKPRTLKEKD